MKLSSIINSPLGLFGLKLVRSSKLKKLQAMQQLQEANGLNIVSDIEHDQDFMRIYEKVKKMTIVSIERCYCLYQSMKYIIRNDIKGDLVECGVWKGGSAMLMAYVLLKAGQSERKIFLYDTFEGMPEPGEMDGEFERKEWERLKTTNGGSEWCRSTIDEVKTNMLSTGYPPHLVEFVKGKVEETIPGKMPAQIALLRLDTDWYESTKHELLHLFPRLEKNGSLFIDDYGAWQGASKATDEYFKDYEPVFLNRVDWTGRLIIKK